MVHAMYATYPGLSYEIGPFVFCSEECRRQFTEWYEGHHAGGQCRPDTYQSAPEYVGTHTCDKCKLRIEEDG